MNIYFQTSRYLRNPTPKNNWPFHSFSWQPHCFRCFLAPKNGSERCFGENGGNVWGESNVTWWFVKHTKKTNQFYTNQNLAKSGLMHLSSTCICQNDCWGMISLYNVIILNHLAAKNDWFSRGSRTKTNNGWLSICGTNHCHNFAK